MGQLGRDPEGKYDYAKSMSVRQGIGRDAVEILLAQRVGLSERKAKQLAGHWFDRQYRHGGIEFRRQEYLNGMQRRKAFGVGGLRPVEAPAYMDVAS